MRRYLFSSRPAAFLASGLPFFPLKSLRAEGLRQRRRRQQPSESAAPWADLDTVSAPPTSLLTSTLGLRCGVINAGSTSTTSGRSGGPGIARKSEIRGRRLAPGQVFTSRATWWHLGSFTGGWRDLTSRCSQAGVPDLLPELSPPSPPCRPPAWGAPGPQVPLFRTHLQGFADEICPASPADRPQTQVLEH